MAVLIGLIVVNFVKPGIDSDIDISMIKVPSIVNSQAAQDVTFVSVLTDIVPDNIINAIVQENMLGVIFFSLLANYHYLLL